MGGRFGFCHVHWDAGVFYYFSSITYYETTFLHVYLVRDHLSSDCVLSSEFEFGSILVEPQ
jgi:hypothetical protein